MDASPPLWREAERLARQGEAPQAQVRLTKKERKALEEERKALISFINHRDRWVQIPGPPDTPTFKYVSNHKILDEEMKE